MNELSVQVYSREIPTIARELRDKLGPVPRTSADHVQLMTNAKMLIKYLDNIVKASTEQLDGRCEIDYVEHDEHDDPVKIIKSFPGFDCTMYQKRSVAWKAAFEFLFKHFMKMGVAISTDEDTLHDIIIDKFNKPYDIRTYKLTDITRYDELEEGTDGQT